mgnify:CR=1 FL=1
MSSRFEEMKPTFRRFNPHMIRMWRWTWGALPSFLPPLTGKIMLLTHVGRTSGRRMLVPVNYAVVDGDVWCTTHESAQWLRNLQVHPETEVRLPLRRARHGVVEVEPAGPHDVDVLRRVLRNAGFAASAFGGVHPRTDPDQTLLAGCEGYHLVRIRRGDVVRRAR